MQMDQKKSKNSYSTFSYVKFYRHGYSVKFGGNS